MNHDDLMDRFQRTLMIAIRNDAIMMVMDTLVKIAELLIEKQEKERAVEILVFIFQYPTRPETHLRAEALYLDLITELPSRAILDAKILADELTLDDLLAAIVDKH